MDVLLVNVNIKEITPYARKGLPLGLAYIGAILQESGYEVSAIDLNLTTLNANQIKQKIQAGKPAILAISTCTASYNNSLKIAKLAKEVDPKIKVIIGGSHVSVLFKEAAKEPNIDVVVIGEGEYTMLELTDLLIRKRGHLGDIKGIAYKDNGSIKVTDKRPFISNIDNLPFPARELFPTHLYRKPNTLITSRGGCPIACHFCSVNKIWGSKRQFRNSENVMQEIASIIDNPGNKGADITIDFFDDAFTLNREYTFKLCRLMWEFATDKPFRWECMARVDMVDAELINEMRRAGCYQIQYGIEAGSQEILDSIGKKITLEQIKKAVSDTLNSGVVPFCFFMFPFPEDTEQTVKEQIRFMKELFDMGAALSLAITNPLPGTYFYDNADKIGITLLSNNWDDYDCSHLIFSTKTLPLDKLQSLFAELCRQVPLNVRKK